VSFVFSVRLSGRAVEVDQGRYWLEAQSDTDAIASRGTLEVWEDGSLVETGELSFGADDRLTYRARGAFGSGAAPPERHGTAVLEVTGGSGRFVGARGYVTSNFLLSGDGELTDHHYGLLHLKQERKETR
jgi:hypothetical protein